jgi:hypothetical protein
MTTTVAIPHTTAPELSLLRLHAMRGGYLLMGVGLALVKWPKLPDAHTMPLYEGVTLCLLTALSLLAFLGLRYPVKLLPVLLFEPAWKALWFAVVALPQALDGGLHAGFSDVAANCSLGVVIMAVIPWRHAWDSLVRTPGVPGVTTVSVEADAGVVRLVGTMRVADGVRQVDPVERVERPARITG